MRVGKVFIDFFATATGDEAAKTWPVSWSVNNVLVFGRGNRVHYKNLTTNEDVAQLCKLKESVGDLRFLECAGKDQPNTVAAGTSTGCIQIWDISAKKNTAAWQATGASVMKWNGHMVTVGLQKGTIKHYDSRTPKSKETIKRVTRHQAKITSLAWNTEGKLYASGDETGVVFVWDIRHPGVPVEQVGDMVQRRRKIQHTGAVTALAWCPWQTKILATGDSTPEKTGTIRVWTVGGSTSSMYQSPHPDKIELDAPVTSLHFSSHCKEILSTHGPGKTTPAPQTYTEDLQLIENDPIPSPYSNSVVVHSYPSLRHVVTLPGANSNIAGSLLSPNGQKIVLAVPEENKLKIWDVWARPTLRRTASALSIDGRIR
ncbi:WD40-repeat-containing domain protein [Irpex rosettiformis]|uniref:WD40-repeat-containing domain protein n=1 Tax=Irpex rosettiformis TaxID=378272 RepID=A0ACB8TU54_9APHY|nr:WD40-repeat-containing domain protein [Irpex rosettiformis]